MKRILLSAALVGALAGAAFAEKPKSDPGKVAAKLKGTLVTLKDGKLASADLKKAPEYYVVYHSASW